MWVGLSLGMSTPRIRGMDYSSTLTLLVSGGGADDQQLTVPPDQLAVLTDTLHTRTDFHGRSPFLTAHSPREEICFLAAATVPDKRAPAIVTVFRHPFSFPRSAWERRA